MRNKTFFYTTLLMLMVFCSFARGLFAQQQDVPESVFMNFSIQPPYIPTYHGRDPFKPLSNIQRTTTVSISDLDYHGMIEIGDVPIALFTWRGNPMVEYTLKYQQLYSGAGKPVDGVIGKITNSEVVLIQDGLKMVYPRN